MSEDFGIEITPNYFMVEESGEEAPPDMECIQLHQSRTQQPFHYLINEQAKSLLALQELQNEVGALLEFRDLVMETFPNLRQKMSGSSSNIPGASGSLNSRHWEPGIKVKRKIVNKEGESFRSRSNSNGSKQPKSTEAISGVQDSGFSTETNSSSSKDHTMEKKEEKMKETEDELWNLLDVIHTKGSRLKEEVETLQLMLMVDEMENHMPERRCRSLDTIDTSSSRVRRMMDADRETLLDTLADVQSENCDYKLKTCRLQEEVGELTKTKVELEEQLRVVVEEKSELNCRLSEFAKSDKISRTKSVCNLNQLKLGTLDKVLNNPRRIRSLIKSIKPDRSKINCILSEKNYVELQRHLLVYVFENQSLSSQLETTIKVKEDLFEQLDKYKEENDELKFLLEERNIELEGTRARVRVLEKQKNGDGGGKRQQQQQQFRFLEDDGHLKSKGFSDMEINRARQIFMNDEGGGCVTGGGAEAPSVLPILALPMPVLNSHQSSGTESTHALEISSELEADMSRKSVMSLRCHDKSPYKRRPSKIPLNIQRTTSPSSANSAPPSKSKTETTPKTSSVTVTLKKLTSNETLNSSISSNRSPSRNSSLSSNSQSMKVKKKVDGAGAGVVKPKQNTTPGVVGARKGRDSFRRNDSLTSIRNSSIVNKHSSHHQVNNNSSKNGSDDGERTKVTAAGQQCQQNTRTLKKIVFPSFTSSDDQLDSLERDETSLDVCRDLIDGLESACSDIDTDSLNSPKTKTNLFQEVKRNFQRKISQKLAQNGVKFFFNQTATSTKTTTKPTDYNVWNNTNRVQEYFDSINREQIDSLLIDSCSYFHNNEGNVDNVVDSIEIKPKFTQV